MKVRHRKLVVMAAMYYIVGNARWDRWINQALGPTMADREATVERNRAHFEEMLRPQIEPSPAALENLKAQEVKIWKVARAKDNVVVLETEDLGEAEEAILKAARQKKARLYLLDDQPYVFEA